jgi:hypothetical protein
MQKGKRISELETAESKGMQKGLSRELRSEILR